MDINVRQRPLHRDAVLFLLGTLISNLGNGIQLIVTSYLTLVRTGSVSAVGLLFMLTSLPEGLVSLFCGRLADRCDRRRLSIAIDVLRGLIALALPLAMLLGKDTLGLLYLTGFLLALGDAVFLPATNAIMQVVTPAASYSRYSAWYEICVQSGALISVAFGGLLVQRYGSAPALIFNSATYFVSAVLLALMRAPAGDGGAGQSPQQRPQPALLRELGRAPALLSLGLLFATFRAIITVVNTLLVVLIVQDLKAGIEVLSIADAGAGLGIVLAGALSSALLGALGTRPVAGLGLLGCALALALMPLFNVTAAILLTVAATMCFGWAKIAVKSQLLTLIPPARAGQYYGLFAAVGVFLSAFATYGVTQVAATAGTKAGYLSFAAGLALVTGLALAIGRSPRVI